MDNKQLLKQAIEALQSLENEDLSYVRIDVTDSRDGDLNLSIDVDYSKKPKKEERVFKPKIRA